MKYKKWNHAELQTADIQGLIDHGIPTLAATLLCGRGVTTSEEVDGFLDHSKQPMNDPILLKDMDVAVTRVQSALELGEIIAVYGDYDVDGITSTSLLTQFLKSKGGQVVSYIPDRMDDGYGLNKDSLSKLHQQGVKLVITVDCGITAVEEVEHAKALGLDVVITDHHSCKDVMPSALAVVDPQRPDCPYPFKGLAGVGVALKLALALTPEENREEVLNQYADLATLGTVADVMPLIDENRTLVKLGLTQINKVPSVGLKALIDAVNSKGKNVTATQIGFMIAPRINAAGRMGCASRAAEMLMSDCPNQAKELAEELCQLNVLRQETEANIIKECEEIVENYEKVPLANVLASESWHQGVVGIVASRLSEKYRCPTFMICLQDGKGKGSCRSYGGVNLFKALESCSDCLLGFGGHAMAAGFTIEEEKIPELRQRLEHFVEHFTGGEPLESVLEVDGDLGNGDSLTIEHIQGLDVLEPYGAGNHKPTFSLLNCRVVSQMEVGGGKHLKMRVEKGGNSFDTIFFSANIAQSNVLIGDIIDVAFTPQINEFGSKFGVQLLMTDLRPAQEKLAKQWQLTQLDSWSKEQAQTLLPHRSDFANLWRYLKAKKIPLEMEPWALTRDVARSYGGSENMARTLIALRGMAEQGLLTWEPSLDKVQITLESNPDKVDLEQAPVMLKLKEIID